MDAPPTPGSADRPATGALLAAALLLVALAMSTAPAAPLFDPDEGYYPATAAESLRDGRFWDLRYNGAPRWDKPVLSYTLIQVAVRLFGPSAAAARLPSSVEAAALLLAAGYIVSWLAGRRAGLLAAVVLGSSLGIGVFARAAHPEIGLVASTAVAELLICLRLSYRPGQRHWRLAAVAGLVVGYGILAKGPVAVALPALMGTATILVAGRPPDGWRSLVVDSVLAATIALAVSVPWYAAMTLAHGREFLITALWQHNVVRYATTTYGHSKGPLFFLIPTAALIFPWTAAVPTAMHRAWRRPRNHRDLLRTGMLAGAVTTFLFYSLAASKLANYALALVPNLAVLVALALDDEIDGGGTGWQRASAAMLGVLALVLAGGPLVGGRLWTARDVLGGAPADGTTLPSLWRLTMWAAIALSAAAWAASRGRPRSTIAALVATGAVLPVLLLVPAAPVLRHIYPWSQFGAAITGQPGPVYLVGYRAPSLTFYAGRPVRVVTPADLEPALAADAPAWVIVDRHSYDHLTALPAGATLTPCAAGARMVLLRAGHAGHAASCGATRGAAQP